MPLPKPALTGGPLGRGAWSVKPFRSEPEARFFYPFGLLAAGMSSPFVPRHGKPCPPVHHLLQFIPALSAINCLLRSRASAGCRYHLGTK